MRLIIDQPLHQPSAISHQPSAISHQPSAISHQPSAGCSLRLVTAARGSRHQQAAVGKQLAAARSEQR
jgi:hypothetical protein